MIVNSDSGEITHKYNGIPFILCKDGIHSVDRTLTTEGPDNQLGDIVINEKGNYKMVVGQYGKTVEKEFSVIAAEDDSAKDSIDDITFDRILRVGEQNAHDFAIEVTSDLNR